ncbi:MAG: ABC transporter substrate-binding protein [Bacteroidia bacterium]
MIKRLKASKAILYRLLEINSFTLVIHMVLLLISCQNGSSEHTKQVFYLNSSNGISSLDPAFARTQENIRAVNQLFNGLVQLDDDLKIKDCLAKSWQISEDGLLYTFKLKKGVFFHKHPSFKNNEDRIVTARDFVFSFNRILDPELASDGAWIFNGLVDTVSPFEAPNDSTFIIKLQKPFAPFLNMLSMSYCYVVPEKVVQNKQLDFGKNPIGTGPFKFSNWSEGIKLNFIRNDEYFEASENYKIPYIDAVSISFIMSKQTALLKYTQGSLSVFTGLESSYKDELLKANGELQDKYGANHHLIKAPFLNTEYLAFNMESEQFKNYTLRRAINLAIDPNAMVVYLRNNVGHPAFGGFVPQGLPSHVSESNLKRNLEEASRLAAQLEPHEKKFTLTTTKDYLDLCVLAQNDLKAIGIEMKIDVLPSSMLKQQKSAGEVDFFRSSWIADYPDGENYMACFYSKNKAPNGPNYTRYFNSEFDILYEELIKTTDENKRIDLIHEMETILLNDLPFVLLFYDQSVWLKPKAMKGLKVNPLNHLDLREVQLN